MVTKLKFNRGTVIFKQYPNGSWYASLWLINVKRNKDNSIKSGYVVNGAWNYERTDTEELAKDIDNTIVNRWPIESYKEIEVSEDWIEVKQHSVDCYNKVMQRAQAILLEDQHYNYKFKSKEELNRIKLRQQELESLLEDDITF